MSETIEETPPSTSWEDAPQNLAVDRPRPENALPVTKATSQEMRVVEVTQALEPAYQRASTLEMTDEEIAALTEPFPDNIIEIRPHDGLIYLPHIFVRNRMNKVFKPGKWALIRRRDWFDPTSNTMYGEYVLVVRGCYVGESVGGHPYVPNNPKTNLSDALESTSAEALRRICGKQLSCGSQVWEPEYARQWVAKFAYQDRGKWHKKTLEGGEQTPAQRPAAATSSTAKPSQSAAAPSSNPPKPASPVAQRTWRDYLFEMIRKQDALIWVWSEAVAQGWILETEKLDAVTDSKIPRNKADFDKFWALVEQRKVQGMTQEIQEAFEKAHHDPDEQVPGAEMPPPSKAVEVPRDPEAAWRKTPIPAWSKHVKAEGFKTFGDLPKDKLWWWCCKWEPVGYNGADPKPTDLALREMLDHVKGEYNFEDSPDDKS